MKDYISKLVERSLQKRSKLGLTFYTLIIGLIAISYEIFNLVTGLKSGDFSPLLSSFVFNCLVLLLLGFRTVIFTEINVGIKSTINKILNRSRTKGLYWSVSICTLFTLLMMRVGDSSEEYLYYPSIFYFGIIMSVNFTKDTFNVEWIGRRKSIYFDPNEIARIDKHKDIKYSVFSIILSIGLLIAPIGINVENIDQLFIQFPLSIKLGALAFLLIVVVYLLFQYYSNKDEIIWLKNLERNLYFGNINEDEVKIRLSDYFYGKSPEQWLEENYEKLHSKFLDLKNNMSNFNEGYVWYTQKQIDGAISNLEKVKSMHPFDGHNEITVSYQEKIEKLSNELKKINSHNTAPPSTG